jgi:NADP-dependent 3-hydroxy acid dehydrogenase YdfG
MRVGSLWCNLDLLLTDRSCGVLDRYMLQVTSSMKCLQPSDVADAVLWCLCAPDHMEVNDIVIRPTEQMI